MFITLTPIKEGKVFDGVGYNSDLIMSVRNVEDHGLLIFINGQEIEVKERRKEIVQRINQSKD